MFRLYTAKVLARLQRPLTGSELILLAQFHNNGYSVNYAVEYFR